LDFKDTKYPIDYSALDRPETLTFLFHPRPEWTDPPVNSENLMIPVQGDVAIGARFHPSGQNAPTILFFHGNGEIVADYDDVGPMYTKLGINFLPVDYRGYGRSGGQPTITSMMRDCHIIFKFIRKWLSEKAYVGPLIVMGRSLGSASALEIAANYEDELEGLIIESGFAYAAPLLRVLGIDPDAIGFREEQGLRNIDKISAFHKPTLIIHAEYDQLIPFSEGAALFEACRAKEKHFLRIPGANHNDIFIRGLDEYLKAIKDLCMLIAAQNRSISPTSS